MLNPRTACLVAPYTARPGTGVTADNDAPTNSVPGPQSTAEDTALTFSTGFQVNLGVISSLVDRQDTIVLDNLVDNAVKYTAAGFDPFTDDRKVGTQAHADSTSLATRFMYALKISM